MSSISEQREKDYETSVRDDAYRARVSLEVRDGGVFIVTGDSRELLCRPQILKRFWYETWLAFKERYAGTPGFGD